MMDWSVKLYVHSFLVNRIRGAPVHGQHGAHSRQHGLQLVVVQQGCTHGPAIPVLRGLQVLQGIAELAHHQNVLFVRGAV